MTFQHRAGVSPYTSPYGFARTCVFSKQSLPPGLCGPPPQPATGPQGTGPPFSQSYGGILPSSFTTVHPPASAYSAGPPVSVSGTGGPHHRVGAFLGTPGSPCFPTPRGRSPSRLTLVTKDSPPDLPGGRATRLDGPSHQARGGYHCASPLLTRLPTKAEDPQTRHHHPHPGRNPRQGKKAAPGVG